MVVLRGGALLTHRVGPNRRIVRAPHFPERASLKNGWEPVAKFTVNDKGVTEARVVAWRKACFKSCGAIVESALPTGRRLIGEAKLRPGDPDLPWFGHGLALYRACGQDFTPPKGLWWFCTGCGVRSTYRGVKNCFYLIARANGVAHYTPKWRVPTDAASNPWVARHTATTEVLLLPEAEAHERRKAMPYPWACSTFGLGGAA